MEVGALGDSDGWEALVTGLGKIPSVELAASPERWLLKSCAFTQVRLYSLQSMDQRPASDIQELLDMCSSIFHGILFWRERSMLLAKGSVTQQMVKNHFTNL